MSKIKSATVAKSKDLKKAKAGKKYISPEAVSMEVFALKTAVGVSPALKKDENYILSTLF